MTVAQETPIASSTANGVTTVFPHAFTVLNASDLVVKGLLLGVVTTYVLNVGYTVQGVGTVAGSVTFTVAPANGTIVTRYRNSLLQRLTDYQSNGDLLADTLDLDFDRLWLAMQEGTAVISQRAVRAPTGEVLNDMPNATTRAGYLLGFDSLGQPIIVTGQSGTASSLALDLATSNNAAKGSGQVGAFDIFSGPTYLKTVSDIINGDEVSLLRFITAANNPATYANIRAGTDATDWSSRINEALANTGISLIVPRGTYNCENLVAADGMTLRGAGRPLFKAITAGRHILAGASLTNISLSGIRFQGVNSTTAPLSSIGGFATTSTGLVTFAACTDVRIEDIEAKLFYSGISALNCSRVWVESNRVLNWSVYGVLASLCKDFDINFNRLIGCDQAGGVNAYGVSATGDEAGGNIQRASSISFNIIRDIPSWDGIMSHDCDGMRIHGNDIRNVRLGLDIGFVGATNKLRSVQAIGNYIESTAVDTWAGVGASHCGILFVGFDATNRADSLTAQGNQISNFFTMGGAPVFSGSPAHISVVAADRVNVTGNTIRNAGNVGGGGPAVYLSGTMNQAVVSGNIGQGRFAAGGVRAASVICDVLSITGNSIAQTVTTEPAVQITGSTISNLALHANPTNSSVPFVQSTSTITWDKSGAGSGSFTATLTGCTTAPTATVLYVVTDNLVTLTIPSVSATSNATTCTLTGLPAYIQPATLNASCNIVGQNAGAYSNNITAAISPGSGTITLSFAGSGAGWTNTGVKGT